MHAFNEFGHPNAPLADWHRFLKEVSPFTADKVVDRSAMDLPKWFVPLARGGVVASASLLQRAGYLPRSQAPVGWEQSHQYTFVTDTRMRALMVSRACFGQNDFWQILRWKPFWRRKHPTLSESLVFQFGSTLILAPNHIAAMHLAEFYSAAEPTQVRWVESCPDDEDGAMKLLQEREADDRRQPRAANRVNRRCA